MEQAEDPFAELKAKFVPTFVRSCFFWLPGKYLDSFQKKFTNFYLFILPAQTINFYWVPSRFRVVYVGTCSLIWANILCWVKRQKTDAIEEKKN